VDCPTEMEVHETELFRISDYAKTESPNPIEIYRQTIVTKQHRAENVAGIFMVLPAGA
jgi:hypothetical protein